MKKLTILILALALPLAGCCDNPGVFSKIGDSMNTINAVAQPFYGPAAEGVPEAQMAVAAAAVAAPLADTLQKQWCPAPADVQKLENLAKSLKTTERSMKSRGMMK